MIDGIKLECNYLQPETWLQNDLLDFTMSVSRRTGEVVPDTTRAKYNGLNFKVTPSQQEPAKSYCNLEGSLHRYHNNGGDNANDFNFDDLQETITDLQTLFNVDPDKSIIHNLEFGVNISLPIPADQFLKSIISLPDKRFSDLSIEKIKLGKICRRTEYDTKIYNKGKQAGKEADNLVRIELRVTKMRWLHKRVNIKTLSDLRNPENLTILGNLLNEAFSDVIIFNSTIKDKLLSTRERILIRDFRNPEFWQGLNFKQRQKKSRSFNTIVAKYSTETPNIKQDVSKLIREKWVQLSPVNNPHAAQKKDMISPLECTMKTYPKESIKILPGIETEPTPAPINPIEKRFCKICGRDISSQKAGSLFCSEKLHGHKAKRCRNKASGQARTERNRQKRQKEALQLNKLYLIDRTTIKAIRYTTNDHRHHRRKISKLYLSKKEIKKVVLVKIAGFEFTTLRAKAVMRYLLTKF